MGFQLFGAVLGDYKQSWINQLEDQGFEMAATTQRRGWQANSQSRRRVVGTP
jgi:hypothetical protein